MSTLAIKDFLPRMNRFAAHWEEAETALGQQIVVRPGDWTRADLLQLRDELDEDAAARSGTRVGVKETRTVLEADRDALLGRLLDFNRNVRARLPDTPFAHNLPKARTRTLAPWRHEKSLRDMASLWADINAAQAPEPFILSAGYSLDDFRSDLDAFTAAIDTWRNIQQDRKLVIAERAPRLDEAYALMKAYRLTIHALFAPGSAIVNSLPRLTPKAKRKQKA